MPPSGRPPRTPRAPSGHTGPAQPGPTRSGQPPARGGQRHGPAANAPHKAAQHGAPSAPEDSRKLFRVAGLSAVSALFANAPQRVERLFFDERLKPAVEDFCKTMAAARKPYRMVEADELAKVAGTVLHGGVVALMAPRTVPAFDSDAARRWREPLLILDGVGNPHNLGAILRTAAFFGLPRVLISGHPGQALPSEAAYRVAEGGFEWVDLLRADPLPLALKRLRTTHRIIGTALDASRPTIDTAGLATDARDPRPPAVILGNEEQGVAPATLAACEAVLTIPGSGRVQSLNVAATAAILIHALATQR